MRKSWRVVLAAGGTWPDAGTPGPNCPFNWVLVDNQGGSNSVAVGWELPAGSATPYKTVKPNSVRVFNCGAPRPHAADDPHPSWPEKLYLSSASGTTVVVEVADYPLVDLISVTT